MNLTLRKDADAIIASSLNAVLPDEAVRRALKAFAPKGGRVLLVAAGKAAWQMAHAAVEALGRVDGGVVVTKYEHVRGEILGVNCYEAGHPVPDENSFAATEKALELVQGLTAEDTVLFLLSGGGSALFEKAAAPRHRIAGHHRPAPCQWRRHRGDEHHPQTAFGRQGRAVRAGLRPGTGVQHRAQRYSGRPAGYDRQRPGGAGHLYLRTGACHCGEVSPEALGTGKSSSGAGNAQDAGQCDDPDHRQCAGALHRRRCRLPGAWL